MRLFLQFFVCCQFAKTKKVNKYPFKQKIHTNKNEEIPNQNGSRQTNKKKMKMLVEGEEAHEFENTLAHIHNCNLHFRNLKLKCNNIYKTIVYDKLRRMKKL